ADWQEVWHSPQPPFLALSQRLRVLRVLICSIFLTSKLVSFAYTLTLYSSSGEKARKNHGLGEKELSVTGGAVAVGAAVLGLDAGLIAAGIEGVHGELNAAEDVAGTLGGAHAAGLAADLGGNAVVKGRDQKLGIPLQADDGE